jgi:hypothetical protein
VTRETVASTSNAAGTDRHRHADLRLRRRSQRDLFARRTGLDVTVSGRQG